MGIPKKRIVKSSVKKGKKEALEREEGGSQDFIGPKKVMETLRGESEREARTSKG